MRQREKTRRLALCATLSALGVVILYLGAIVEVLDLSLAALAPVLVIYVAIELDGPWPWLVYLVTGLLALLLLPQKFGAGVYLLFSGFYPMVKQWAERRLPRLLSLVAKLAVFQLSLLAAWLLMRAFALPLDFDLPWAYVILFCEITFLLYDFVLTRFISIYVYRWRQKLKFRK